MAVKRILTGGIAQESHSFNPVLATRAEFDVFSGVSAVAQARGTNATLGGIVDAAEAAGAEVVLPTLFRAQSGGPVEDAVYREVREVMCDAARAGGFDAIVLPLHGGMLTPTLSDPEADLMRALRDIVGPAVPIAAAFDLHAHVTAETLAPCDFLTGYKTNPHGDQAATGRRACDAALRMLDGRFDPVCALVRAPMLTLGQDRTDEEPLQALHALARRAVEAGTVDDVSIFNAQQFLDVPGLGQAVLAYGNGRSDAAEAMALDIAGRLWAARDAFVGAYPSLESCLARAASGPGRPLILGDQGDRVAAGGPGDSTVILHALLQRFPNVSAAVPVADAEAVARCIAAGPGASLTLTFGGRISRMAPPMTAAGTVVAVGEDISMVCEGPHEQGQRKSLGRYAVFRTGQVTVALTVRPLSFLDPNYYRALGIPLGEVAVAVVRSGYHFTLNFAATGECVTVDTPGMTSYRVHELPFTAARPFHPLDPVAYTPVATLRRRAA